MIFSGSVFLLLYYCPFPCSPNSTKLMLCCWILMSRAEQKSLTFYCSVGKRHGSPPLKPLTGQQAWQSSALPIHPLWALPSACACLLEYRHPTAWHRAKASQCISRRPANSCLMISKCYEPTLGLFSLPTREKLCVVLCHAMSCVQ